MKCKKCSNYFEPTQNDIKNSDYVCPLCKKVYQRMWREKRRLAGLQASGSKTWEEAKKRKWLSEYYSRPDIKRKIADNQKRYRNDPRLREKCLARWVTNRMKKSGKIQSEPCSFCGEQKTQAHHLDYKKPLLIAWLCRKCHEKLHAEGRD